MIPPLSLSDRFFLILRQLGDGVSEIIASSGLSQRLLRDRSRTGELFLLVGLEESPSKTDNNDSNCLQLTWVKLLEGESM